MSWGAPGVRRVSWFGDTLWRGPCKGSAWDGPHRREWKQSYAQAGGPPGQRWQRAWTGMSWAGEKVRQDAFRQRFEGSVNRTSCTGCGRQGKRSIGQLLHWAHTPEGSLSGSRFGAICFFLDRFDMSLRYRVKTGRQSPESGLEMCCELNTRDGLNSVRVGKGRRGLKTEPWKLQP